MVKIKILQISPPSNHCYECGGDSFSYDITDWDEVTEDQYKKLMLWIKRKNKEKNTYRDEPVQYAIVTEYTESATSMISEYLSIAHADEVKAAETTKKRKASAEKRAKTKKEKQEVSERQMLKDLNEKYK